MTTAETGIEGQGDPPPAGDRTVAVLQPSYLPWIGAFDQINRCDVFVHYDDVQYDKHGWRNRNRIKSPRGSPHWLTVPVRTSDRNRPRIDEIEIVRDTPWARKHLETLRHFYGGAPYVDRYLPELAEVLNRPWVRLVDLNLEVVSLICRWLGLDRPMVRSSRMVIPGRQSHRLLQIARQFRASRYLTGDAARAYLDVELFRSQGVDVTWQDYHHPTYPQLHGPFVSHLSVIDLILNCGDSSRDILGVRPDRRPRP